MSVIDKADISILSFEGYEAQKHVHTLTQQWLKDKVLSE